MKEPRRVAFGTLGCKLNQFETDSLATQFQQAGYRIVDLADPADVYVINTCTVTNRADRKSRNLLYRAQRAAGITSSGQPPVDEHHDAATRPGGSGRLSNDLPEAPMIILTGCHVDSHRDQLESDGSTFLVPNEHKQSILSLAEAHAAREVFHPAGSVFDFPVPGRLFHTRSMVKVQDGCDNFCSFCIIPYVRGRAKSRPHQDVIRAVADAVDGGAREVVLTGVNMSRYTDSPIDFPSLVEQCLKVPGDFRLRLSSLEPDRIDDHFVELFGHPKMCPHLHLCLQSASERVLLAMRRQYTYAEFARLARRLRAAEPTFNLTTDLIVGFPGETEEEHRESLRSIDELGFGHVHTFIYSLRSGTRAERLPDHIPAAVKTVRSEQVRTLAEAAKRAYRQRLVGTGQTLLVEKSEALHNGTFRLSGLGEHYVPITVSGTGPAPGENQFVRVRVTGLEEGPDPSLIALPLDEGSDHDLRTSRRPA